MIAAGRRRMQLLPRRSYAGRTPRLRGSGVEYAVQLVAGDERNIGRHYDCRIVATLLAPRSGHLDGRCLALVVCVFNHGEAKFFRHSLGAPIAGDERHVNAASTPAARSSRRAAWLPQLRTLLLIESFG